MFRSYTCAMQKTVSAIPVLAISLAGLTLAACGSPPTGGSSPSSTSAPATAAPTAAPTPTPTAATVSLTCPAASTINSALGLNVSTAKTIPSTDLPTGDTGVTCEYLAIAAQSVVILTVGTGPVSVPFISLVQTAEQKAAQAQGETIVSQNVSGVGSQAVILTVSKTGVPKEDSILAVSGQSGLVLTVVPSTTDSKLEAFASQLIG